MFTGRSNPLHRPLVVVYPTFSTSSAEDWWFLLSFPPLPVQTCHVTSVCRIKPSCHFRLPSANLSGVFVKLNKPMAWLCVFGKRPTSHTFPLETDLTQYWQDYLLTWITVNQLGSFVCVRLGTDLSTEGQMKSTTFLLGVKWNQRLRKHELITKAHGDWCMQTTHRKWRWVYVIYTQ